MQNESQLIPHLFRKEFGKITSVLCRFLGIQHLEAAEDLASDTFVAAMETWPYKGIPDNPQAWLYAVAKNKAKNYLQRRNLFDSKVVKDLKAGTDQSELQPDLSETNISDSQLNMLFAVCHPAISNEAQVGLALRTLCGFSIDEIANAFLSNKETINKRLFRAREKLREENISIELPPVAEIDSRLSNVLTTIYLLFNEGYYSESDDNIIRKDLCLEAMRLALLLTTHEETDRPEVSALLAMMCFHASRLDARKNHAGEIILYDDQDTERWDKKLIERGAEYLHRSARGNSLSQFHLEASIAYWHTVREDNDQKWKSILKLYDQLLQFNYTSIAALNRVYAVFKVKGPAEAIHDAEQLQMDTSHFYYALLGELYSHIDHEIAAANFTKAILLAKTDAEKKNLQRRIQSLN